MVTFDLPFKDNPPLKIYKTITDLENNILFFVTLSLHIKQLCRMDQTLYDSLSSGIGYPRELGFSIY